MCCVLADVIDGDSSPGDQQENQALEDPTHIIVSLAEDLETSPTSTSGAETE